MKQLPRACSPLALALILALAAGLPAGAAEAIPGDPAPEDGMPPDEDARSAEGSAVPANAPVTPPAATVDDDIPNAATSVLSINVTSQPYNFRLPWQKDSPETHRALGALLQDRKVLTTAESIANATYIELEKPDTGRKITARVEGVDYEANLALVRAEDDPGDFFEDMIPLSVSSDAALGDDLEVWQFEGSGTPLKTKLELSNFDIGHYFLDNSFFLVYEALGNLQSRDGHYTLPVVRDDSLVGLLLDYDPSEQISRILPGPIIRRFLDDLSQPPYQGFPNFGIRFATMLDEQLRAYTKSDGSSSGIFVSGVMPDTSAATAGVQEGDVIAEISGRRVDARGFYQDPIYGRLSISHLVRGAAQAGDVIPIKVLRNGEEIELEVTLTRKDPSEYLVPPYMFDRGPKYLIMGGMLFEELTLPFLESAGDNWETRAPFKLVHAYNNPEKYKEEGRDKLVFLSGVIPSASTLGYERLSSLIVDKVNGRQINSISDLDAAFEDPGEDGIHKIEFTEYPHVIYLDDEAARRDNEDLMPNRYRIFQLKRLE